MFIYSFFGMADEGEPAHSGLGRMVRLASIAGGGRPAIQCRMNYVPLRLAKRRRRVHVRITYVHGPSALHILPDRHNVVGWQLVLKYMCTPPFKQSNILQPQFGEFYTKIGTYPTFYKEVQKFVLLLESYRKPFIFIFILFTFTVEF